MCKEIPNCGPDGSEESGRFPEQLLQAGPQISSRSYSEVKSQNVFINSICDVYQIHLSRYCIHSKRVFVPFITYK